MYKNLFKQVSTTLETLDVNKYSNHTECRFTNTKEGLSRTYSDISILNWETFVYFYLDDKMPGITPEMVIMGDNILYKTKGMVPLKVFLSKNIKMYSCIINELVSFIRTFKKIGFVHGNLHISNIYIDTSSPSPSPSSSQFYKFYIVDFANSYIENFDIPSCKRNSYVNKVIPLEYCDMTTLYHSLTHHLAILGSKSNEKILSYTTSLFADTIVF